MILPDVLWIFQRYLPFHMLSFSYLLLSLGSIFNFSLMIAYDLIVNGSGIYLISAFFLMILPDDIMNLPTILSLFNCCLYLRFTAVFGIYYLFFSNITYDLLINASRFYLVSVVVVYDSSR